MTYFKLVGDDIIKLKNADDVIELRKENKSPGMSDRLFDTEINIFGFKVRVSTVFMYLNHGMNDDAPLLFETMIFCDELENLDSNIFSRCTSLKSATHCHKSAILYVASYLRKTYQKRNKEKYK